MSDVANKSVRRTLRMAACATSAGMLVSFGVTLDGLRYWVDFDGPAALRSDNAHVIFTYEAE